jgi:hypothetical protein
VTVSGPFGKLWSLFGSILSPFGIWSLPRRPEAAHLGNLADTDMAEKFARELLWITEKLLVCGGMEDAVQQWSSASSLAEISLCASPKVQKSLVRLSGILSSLLAANLWTEHYVPWFYILAMAILHSGYGGVT